MEFFKDDFPALRSPRITTDETRFTSTRSSKARFHSTRVPRYLFSLETISSKESRTKDRNELSAGKAPSPVERELLTLWEFYFLGGMEGDGVIVGIGTEILTDIQWAQCHYLKLHHCGLKSSSLKFQKCVLPKY